MLLLNTRSGLVELGLDGNPLSVRSSASNQVNTRIRLTAVVTPSIPAGDLVKLRCKDRIRFEEVDHQLLKRDSVLALGLVLTELIEDFTERRHAAYCALQSLPEHADSGLCLLLLQRFDPAAQRAVEDFVVEVVLPE